MESGVEKVISAIFGVFVGVWKSRTPRGDPEYWPFPGPQRPWPRNLDRIDWGQRMPHPREFLACRRGGLAITDRPGLRPTPDSKWIRLRDIYRHAHAHGLRRIPAISSKAALEMAEALSLLRFRFLADYEFSWRYRGCIVLSVSKCTSSILRNTEQLTDAVLTQRGRIDSGEVGGHCG